MKERKVRFTIWISPEILRTAKARAIEHKMTVSEVLASAAAAKLGGADQLAADEKILNAVERVFFLIQRIEKRRSYDDQVVKEMLGLLIQSFFNHIPAVPEKDKKAALFSGKVRFNRFLDCLAANLRIGDSILHDVPLAELSAAPDGMAESASTTILPKSHGPSPPLTDSPPKVSDSSSHPTTGPKQNASQTGMRGTLFG
jgi:hypothetical protein